MKNNFNGKDWKHLLISTELCVNKLIILFIQITIYPSIHPWLSLCMAVVQYSLHSQPVPYQVSNQGTTFSFKFPPYPLLCTRIIMNYKVWFITPFITSKHSIAAHFSLFPQCADCLSLNSASVKSINSHWLSQLLFLTVNHFFFFREVFSISAVTHSSSFLSSYV